MSILKPGLCPNLSEAVLRSVQKQGIFNVFDFVGADLESLSRSSGVSYKELVAIRRLLLAQYASFPVSGRDVYDEVMSTTAILSTGCTSIDRILDGGIYSCEITEIMGPAAAGKTQLCLSAALSVAADTEQCVMYYDTGGSFDIDRIEDMLENRQLDKKSIESSCSKIRCSRVFDIFELLSELELLKERLKEQPEAFYRSLKLVVVDSVTSVVSPILGGQQIEGHAFMTHLARALKSIASEYALAVLVTNNVVQDHTNGTRPSLGRTWQNIPNTRLELKRPLQEASKLVTLNIRQAVLIKSSRQSLHQKAEFTLTDNGLQES